MEEMIPIVEFGNDSVGNLVCPICGLVFEYSPEVLVQYGINVIGNISFQSVYCARVICSRCGYMEKKLLYKDEQNKTKVGFMIHQELVGSTFN